MSRSAILARGLSRRYGKALALDGLDLEVAPGTVVGLLGDNGAGKSTTMRMMLGLLTPTAGSLEVLGLDPRRQGAELRARVGYVPEDRRLFRHMKCAKILRLMASLQPRWNHSLAGELLERFQIDPAMRIAHLSRGAMAKLYMLMAIAPEPELLILDEATGGLDVIARREILAMLLERVADTGMTVVFASHVIQDIERVADRVVILHRGRKLTDQPLEELRASFGRLRVPFPAEAPEPPAVGQRGIRVVERRRREWELVSDDQSETREFLATTLDPDTNARIESVPLSLEDVFVEVIQRGGAA